MSPYPAISAYNGVCNLALAFPVAPLIRLRLDDFFQILNALTMRIRQDGGGVLRRKMQIDSDIYVCIYVTFLEGELPKRNDLLTELFNVTK